MSDEEFQATLQWPNAGGFDALGDDRGATRTHEAHAAPGAAPQPPAADASPADALVALAARVDALAARVDALTAAVASSQATVERRLVLLASRMTPLTEQLGAATVEMASLRRRLSVRATSGAARPDRSGDDAVGAG